ncbi:MAG: zinc ribbon domain-containing protein [Chitinivibrionales bacterium]|nr:zinc ribbon domain-containing protein [Chitinivibrionales bacterium]
MPIYEFYCPDCHTIYSFLSRTVNTEKTPGCPRCHKESLQRKVSRFAAITGGKKESDDELGDLPIDETRMESAMESLASEAESLDENDPRAAAKLMRKLADMTGLRYGDKMEEAIARLESGEDPEAIESEMGDELENLDDAFVMPGKKGGRLRAMLPPRRDETLYEM